MSKEITGDNKDIMDTQPADLTEKIQAKQKKEARRQKEEARKNYEAFEKRMNDLMAKELDDLSKKELTEVLGWQIRKCREGVDAQVMKVGAEFEGLKEKIASTHNMMKSFLQFQGNFDAKCDVIADIVKKEFGISDLEFDDRVDAKLGLIRRKEGTIEDGDVVFVDYKAEIIGEEGTNFPGRVAENWPVRVGSGAFDGEDALRGRPVTGHKFQFEHEFEKNYSNKAVAGKKVKFDIEILKVKVSTTVLKNREAKKTKETSDERDNKESGSGSRPDSHEPGRIGQSTEVGEAGSQLHGSEPSV